MRELDKHNQSNPAMQELRNLLFEKESARIAAIEELLNNPELHAQEIAKVLAEGDCKLDCVSAYIPLGDKPDETIRNRSLRSQSGERH